MDIKSMVARGHNKVICGEIVDYVGNNPHRFKALLEVFLAGPYRITQRASWPLGICVEREPRLVRPHLKQILAYARREGVHHAVRRNTMRMLQFIDLPASIQGNVMQLAFEWFADRKQPVAVRVFAMAVLENLTITHPKIKSELKIMIEDELPYASAAFRSRGVKILRKLST